MQPIFAYMLLPGDLFAKSPGKTSEIGEVTKSAAPNGRYIEYIDEQNETQVMDAGFIVYIDEIVKYRHVK